MKMYVLLVGWLVGPSRGLDCGCGCCGALKVVGVDGRFRAGLNDALEVSFGRWTVAWSEVWFECDAMHVTVTTWQQRRIVICKQGDSTAKSITYATKWTVDRKDNGMAEMNA